MDSLKYLLTRLAPYAVVFLLIETALRLTLTLRIGETIALSLWEWITLFAVGLSFDLIVLGYFLLPFLLYLLAMPLKWQVSAVGRAIEACGFFLGVFLVLYSAVAEWIFWDEFHVRFNFIAVDYLVYTEEVLANIWESYPVVPLVAVEIFLAASFVIIARRFSKPWRRSLPNATPFRISVAALVVLLPGALFFARDISDAEISLDSDVNELSKNGIYSFVSAFRNNELPYRQFFISGYHNQKPPPIQTVLEEDELRQRFLYPGSDDILRFVPGHGGPLKKNVVFVVMESMSARFMKRFDWPGPGITPTLDRLAGESLFFDRAYATGTRTVRGLEAIVLSIPPSPGRSIVKRPDNKNLSSIGFVFQERGYDTRFIYGGNGYFDNMNYFFANNGFEIIDRSAFDVTEQTFGNAWGLCDEDLYNKSIFDARRSSKAGRPFMHLLMTTSNHRPYTFPAGRPGIPSKGGGRQAGVKYADYALGQYLEAAAGEPWFDNTIFVVIADHTANAAGKNELNPEKYHIPLLIYSPGFIEPKIFDQLASQIDVEPIVLGLLDFSYVNRFYGENLVADFDEKPHVYIANYQKLGYLTGNGIVILRPDKTVVQYENGRPSANASIDEKTVLETIAVYAHASGWRQHMEHVTTLPEKHSATIEKLK